MNCREAARPMPVPQTWGTTEVFHAWAMAAIFLHSVKPPEEHQIRLQNVQCAFGHPAPEADLAEQVLPGGEVGGGQVPQGLVPLQVFGCQRLLEEMDPGILAAEEDAPGRRGIVGAVGVHHDAYLGTHGLAEGVDVPDVGFDPETHLELHGREAFRKMPPGLLHAGLRVLSPLRR